MLPLFLCYFFFLPPPAPPPPGNTPAPNPFFFFFFSLVKLPGLGQHSPFSIFFVGAACSSALTGLFAHGPYSQGTSGGLKLANGSFYDNPVQLGRQISAILIVLLLTVVSSAVIYIFTLVVSKVFGNPTLTLDQGKIDDAKLHSLGATA